MNSLVLFSLVVGGMEVVGRKVSMTDSTLTIEQPMVLRPVQDNRTGAVSVELMPHSLAAPEAEHTFMLSAVLSISSVVPEGLEKTYLERTSHIILSHQLDSMELKLHT